MSIIQRIKSWISKLAFWRSRPDGGTSKQQTDPQPEKPAGNSSGTPPPAVEEQPPTSYLDVGMAYTLEGPQGKEMPRVEVWPLQPSETRVAIVTAGREINAEIINGFERKTNPQVNASWPSLRISNCATQIAVKITNSRVGVLTFGGIDPAKFATFYQKVAIK